MTINPLMATTAAVIDPTLKRFIATQPLFDRRQEVYAYELMFRFGAEDFFGHNDQDLASTTAVDSALLLGVETISRGRKAFIGCSERVIVNGGISLLPPESVVPLLMPEVGWESPVRSACIKLLKSGYSLAAEVDHKGSLAPELLEICTYICFDFSRVGSDQISNGGRALHGAEAKLVGLNIEHRGELQFAMDAGFHYFHGNFFCEPKVHAIHDMAASRVNLLPLLREVNSPEFAITRIEEQLRHEPALCYRLLRCLNSAAFGFASEIRSVRHAIALMGETQLKKWLAVSAIGAMGTDKPSELVVRSLARARFCELMAEKLGMKERMPDMFLMGLLSLMDCILGRPTAELLKDLPVQAEIKAALTGQPGRFRDVYDLVRAYERAQWEKLVELLSWLKLPEEGVPDVYMAAAQWADMIYKAQ